MGRVYIELEVCGPKNCKKVKGEVDTGANVMNLPREILDEIGFFWKGDKLPLRLATGERIETEPYSIVVKYRDRVVPTYTVSVDSDVVVDRETIEKLNLVIDPVDGKVIEKPFRGLEL